jgi:ABC-2 type transport system ATP-binding protein
LIAGGSPEQLKTEYIRNPMLEVETTNAIEAMTVLEGMPSVVECSVFGTMLHVSIAEEVEGIALVRSTLENKGFVVTRIERITPSLEDVFIHLIDQQTKAGQVAIE